MLTPRTWLVLLQALGALSLLLYPGVLLANIMSIAAPPSANPGAFETVVKGLLWVMLGYPLIWIVLWVVSWRVLRRGRTLLAFVLSTPPALFFVALGLALFGSSFYGASIMRDYAASRSRVGQAVAAENPLAGALLLFENGEVNWDSLRSTIQSADGGQLNTPVVVPMAEIPGVQVTTFGTVPNDPQSVLAIALIRTELDRWHDSTKANAQFIEAARLLQGRGARLSDHEVQTSDRLVWLNEVVRSGVTLPDPRAREENELVVRIISATAATDAEVSNLIYEYRRTRPELLRKPTTAYGTPLRAALLRSASDHIRSLIYNGALLSEAEMAVPSVTHALDQYLGHPATADLRERYDEALRKAAHSPGHARSKDGQ